MDSNQNKSYEDDDINTYYNHGNEDDVNKYPNKNN